MMAPSWGTRYFEGWSKTEHAEIEKRVQAEDARWESEKQNGGTAACAGLDRQDRVYLPNWIGKFRSRS